MKPKAKLLGVGIALLLVAGMVFVGCSSGISQEDYDAVVAERDVAETALAAAEDQIADLQDQIAGLEDEIAQLKAGQVPALLSVVDELAALRTAPDMNAKVAAFAGLGTAVGAVGDDDLDALLQGVVVGGMQSDEAGAEATLDMAAYMLGVCAEAVAAFPAETQSLLELADEVDAVLAAEDIAAQTAAFGGLSMAVDAIGNAELSALLQGVITGGMESEKAGHLAIVDMIVWILSEANEASQ
ncbi:MAG: hypothetical protein WBC89_07640 [Dehalococcoidia bacterium]